MARSMHRYGLRPGSKVALTFPFWCSCSGPPSAAFVPAVGVATTAHRHGCTPCCFTANRLIGRPPGRPAVGLGRWFDGFCRGRRPAAVGFPSLVSARAEAGLDNASSPNGNVSDPASGEASKGGFMTSACVWTESTGGGHCKQ